MKQRIITVPKDKTAEQALDYNEATPEQLIELVLTDEEFNTLYENGLFTFINEAGASNIDDYESDNVKGEDNIKMVIDVLKLKKSVFDNNSAKIVDQVIDLFSEALSRDTGVYFYF